MPFPINVDNLFDFEARCGEVAGILKRADGDAVRALSIVTQQEALLVEECRNDLHTMSNVCEELSSDLLTLKNAVSELAWSMRSVRSEYLGIAQTAQDCGLLVEGDTVILFDEDVEDCAHSFEELKAQAQVQRLNYERAEYVFSLALESLKVDAYEQWIEPVFNAFKDQFVPNEKHLLANGVACGVGVVDTIGQSTSALTMQHFDGLYKAPEGFLDKRGPVEVDIRADRKTRTGTCGHTTGGSSLGKGRESCRCGGCSCRRRYHRLRHLPNRYRAAPRME